MADYLYGIQEQVKKIITDINAKYKALTNTHNMRVVFEVSDLV
jgi:ABC-type dipeptide/oligopeptide/nickel transport system ATPase component